MAIARTINSFTFSRDWKELHDLIDSRDSVLSALREAKQQRDKIQRVKSMQQDCPEDLTAYIQQEQRELDTMKQQLARELDEYRFRCKCAKMSIKQAREHLAAMQEYYDNSL